MSTLETEADLSSAEIANLRACEEIIERGRKTFLEVGDALMAIRESRLYREQYSSFEAYVQERWNLTARHANRMIAASELAEEVRPIGLVIENENQARELGRLTPDVRQEAIERAREAQPDTEQPLPAKAVIAAAKKVAREENDVEAEPDQLRPLDTAGTAGGYPRQIVPAEPGQPEGMGRTVLVQRGGGGTPAPPTVLRPIDPAPAPERQAAESSPPASVETYPTDQTGLNSLARSQSDGELLQGRIRPPVLLDGKLWVAFSCRVRNGQVVEVEALRVVELDAHHKSLGTVTPPIYQRQLAEGIRRPGDYSSLIVYAPGSKPYVVQGETRRYVVGGCVPEVQALPPPDIYTLDGRIDITRLGAAESFNAKYNVSSMIHMMNWALRDNHLERFLPRLYDPNISPEYVWRDVVSSLCHYIRELEAAKPKPALPAQSQIPALPKDPPCAQCGGMRLFPFRLCEACLEADGEEGMGGLPKMFRPFQHRTEIV